MFLHRIEKTLQPIGTQHAHIAFGRSSASTCSNIQKTFTIKILAVNNNPIPYQQRCTLQRLHEEKVVTKEEEDSSCQLLASRVLCALRVYVVIWWQVDSAYYIVVCVCSLLITVRSLYEGTLVTSRTTAQTVPKRSCWISTAQLAAFSLFLATLTLAARCYASSTTNATHPTNPLVVQLHPTTGPPQALSPIYNSNTHSSNLVLSRLYNKPHQLVQSDTSVILTNSKVLLYYNKNFITAKRTKRELKTNTPYYRNINHIGRPSAASSHSSFTSSASPVNYSYNVRNNRKTYAIRTSSKNSNEQLINNKGKRNNSDDIDVILRTLNTSDDKVLNRIRVNSTPVTPTSPTSIEHQQSANTNIKEDKDGAFLQENQSSPRSTARSMPPVHAHDNESCKWRIIYLNLSVGQQQ